MNTDNPENLDVPEGGSDAQGATDDGASTNPSIAPAAAGVGMGLDLQSMMEMARNMQQQAAEAQQRLSDEEVSGSAGGGAVGVTLNGHLHLRKIHIEASAVDPDDPSMIEDLLLAAWQDAHDQVAVLQSKADPKGGLLGGLSGGDPLGALGDLGGPGGLDGLGGLSGDS